MLQLKGARQIIITQDDHGYTVSEGDTYAESLCFDEMLGQVVELMHPDIGKPRYRMATHKGWQEWHQRLRQAVEPTGGANPE